MDRDDDLARALPEPPPARPARRDAAIALAMRRFDGIAEPLPPVAPDPAATPASGWKLRGAQIGAFASILLVALISIPIAMRSPTGPLARSDQQPTVERPATRPAGPRASPTERPPAPGPAASAAAVATRRAVGPATIAGEPVPGSETRQAAAASGYASAPPPPPASEPREALAPPAPLATISGEATVVVTGRRAAPAPAKAVANAITTVDEAEIRTDDIVVSGTRATRSRAAAMRGDWNACTVNDPQQSLPRCKRLVDTGKKGSAGVAAAHLADGLTRAWQQEWRGAIDAFDKAIALEPRLAFAYLNRGLAWQHEGELERAGADLDLAVRYAPRAARGYYNRSLVRRQRGDERGARADLARAVDLDSRYDELAE